MHRRKFIKSAGLGAAASLAAAPLAAPAIAQSMPEIKWRMPSSFSKSLDTLYGGAELFCQRVAQLTDNKFQIRPFAAGEIVPGLQVLDAVQNGTVEIGQTASYYYIGKDPTFAFDCAVPFGMTMRQHNAWVVHGGGLELMREFYKDYNVLHFVLGNTGAQMGGWFRKEIKTREDINGLKFRIAGLGGQVMAKLGAVPQQIAGGDVYPALEKGTIDAAEWVGPYDDEKLGFYKVAPFYYYPGFWEGCAAGIVYINQKSWDALPAQYKWAVQAAAMEVTVWMPAKYDMVNAQALRRLIGNGVKLRAFPRPVMEAAYKATMDLYDEMAAQNPRFKKVYTSWRKFRDEQFAWFRVNENTYENFVYSQFSKKT